MTRQTKTFLINRLREMGIQPATKHGQNFLIDLNLQRLIVDAAELGPSDVVLEIGTGTGSLTSMIAQQVRAVITVEIDRHLFELASEQLIEQGNTIVMLADYSGTHLGPYGGAEPTGKSFKVRIASSSESNVWR